MSNYAYNTFGDVIDEAYSQLAVDGDATSFPALARTIMEKKANRYRRRFLSRVQLKTMEATRSFTTVADTTVAADASSGATSITITLATDWPASGLCVIEGYPTTFTRSGTTLTVAALPRDFEEGETVQLAYAVPTDYLRPRSIWNGTVEIYLMKRGDTRIVSDPYLSIYGDYFVLPVGFQGEQTILLHYYKKGSNSLAASDTMDIVDMFDDYVVNMLVAYGHGAMYEPDRKVEFKMEANEIMKEAIQHFAKEDGSNHNMFSTANW